MKQLNEAEQSVALTYGPPLAIAAGIVGLQVVNKSTKDKRQVVEEIIEGVKKQPIGQKANNEYTPDRVQKLARRDFLKEVKEDVLIAAPVGGLCVGLGGAALSTLVAQPSRFWYGSPGERELKAIDPEAKMDPLDRVNYGSKTQWWYFLSKDWFDSNVRPDKESLSLLKDLEKRKIIRWYTIEKPGTRK